MKDSGYYETNIYKLFLYRARNGFGAIGPVANKMCAQLYWNTPLNVSIIFFESSFPYKFYLRVKKSRDGVV